MKEIDIKKIRVSLGMNQEEFAKAIGFSRSSVQKWERKERNPDEIAIYKIDELIQKSTNEHIELKKDQEKAEVSEHTEIKGVPYYENIDGTAHITTSFSDYKERPTFYIDYEHFNDCDAYVNVVGDSMYPNYCSGEIIAVKRIYNIDIIQWGEAHFVVTNSNANEMKTIKLLYPHENESKIILRSSNPNFKGDTPVDKKDILFLYIVKGKIRRNQL